MCTTELIVMLTEHDLTIPNATQVFASCKDSGAKYWGMKEKGLPLSQMQQLFDTFHQCGKVGVLEVVAYEEADCLAGAKIAADCGCDMLMGTLYYDSVLAYCREHNIRYMPFVGNVSGRPSVLDGSAEDMVAQARSYAEKGVFGIDLLSYRYRGDAELLTSQVVAKTDIPVCVAGSIDSYEKLDFIRQLSPAFFTIGSAFWAHRFGEDHCEQIRRVLSYIRQPAPQPV